MKDFLGYLVYQILNLEAGPCDGTRRNNKTTQAARGFTIFRYHNTQVRVIEDEQGEPWWVAKDVCDILGLSNVAMVLQGLDEDEKGVAEVDTLGGPQQLAVVSESGLYSLIMRSNKPEAKKFRKWTTSEVLPSVRKHGAYATDGTLARMVANPSFGIRLLTALKEEKEKRQRLEAEKQLMVPKAEFYGHRMIHRSKPMMSIEQMRGIVQKQTK